MTNKERYASTETWSRILREERVSMKAQAIKHRLKEAGFIGRSFRNVIGQIVHEGFYSESDVRVALTDLLNPFKPKDFRDPSKVLTDLNAFAAQLPQTPDDPKGPIYLSTANIMSLSIVCHNGEIISGSAYLSSAAIALGLAENTREAQCIHAKTIKFLLRFCGVSLRDRTYYETKDSVRADLNAFAAQLPQEAGSPKTPLDMGTHNIMRLSIVCQNGERVTGNTYLNNAAVALGLAKDSRDAGYKRAETFSLLLKNAGFEVRDASYYQTPEFILADLNAIAVEFNRISDTSKTPAELSTTSMQSVSFVCHNGERVRAATYLYNAAIALGLASNARGATSKRAEVLKYLKKIAGLLTPSDDQ